MFIEVLLRVFGVLNLISLFFGWCPVYQIAGISTKES
ncbi:YgaP-like transmembrane domain [Alteromonas gilva]